MSDKSELIFDANLAAPLFKELSERGGELGLIWGESGGALSLAELEVAALERVGALPDGFEDGIDANLEIESDVLKYILLGISEGATRLKVGVDGERILFTVAR